MLKMYIFWWNTTGLVGEGAMICHEVSFSVFLEILYFGDGASLNMAPLLFLEVQRV